ncbi:MAG: SapC family protein [Bosea sp. (in: a-proteobacteria)]
MSDRLFLAPEPLSVFRPDVAIYDLAAYPHLANVLHAPVALRELRSLARFLPTAFARSSEGVVPVAILGLVSGHSLAPRMGASDPSSVPLALKAYPLGVMRGQSSKERSIIIDMPPVDPLMNPKPAVTGDGRLTIWAQRKFEAAHVYAVHQQETVDICAELDELEAFETWQLKLRFEDIDLSVSGLLTLKPAYFASVRHRGFLRRNAAAGVALEAHLISKWRLADLAHALAQGAV